MSNSQEKLLESARCQSSQLLQIDDLPSLKTNSSSLKISHHNKEAIFWSSEPRIHFQVLLLLVSGEGISFRLIIN